MNKTLLKIEQLLNNSPNKEFDKSYYLEKAKKYSNECGCSLGGVGVVISMVIFVSYVLFASEISILKTFSIGLFFIFLSAIMGKLLGIGIAKARLLLLYKALLDQRR